jgi:hypothetical protein
MTEPSPPTNLFVVQSNDAEPVLAAVEHSLSTHTDALATLSTLTNVALGDPYLAQQLAELHQQWEVRPQPQRSLLARVRTRLAWWLLGPEMQQINATHATLVRLLDSLIVQLDQERAARRQLEEHLAYTKDERC